ncbi:MAG: rubredoxin [Methanothermobacter sp.]|nr:rubredoxin [Methanothermobacter sp.]
MCPCCDVGKKEFEDSAESMRVRIPPCSCLGAMTVGLWKVMGEGVSGSYKGRWGFVIAENISPGDDPLKSVTEYFIEHGFAASISRDAENILNVKNCRFYGFCRSLEEDGVLLSTCPYANTAAAALERSRVYI